MLPLGTTLVFGNAGSPSYLINRTSDPRVIIRKILPLSDLTTKRQPQILFELGPEDLKCEHKGTKLTQTSVLVVYKVCQLLYRNIRRQKLRLVLSQVVSKDKLVI